MIKTKHHPIAKYDDDDEKPVDGEHDDADLHGNKHDDDDLLLKKI